MYAGTAERLEVPDLQALIPIIGALTPKQAFCYGTVTVPGDRHQVVTKSHQVDGKNISRSRNFYEFSQHTEGVLLIDYDPPKTEKPIPKNDVLTTLTKVVPALGNAEVLVIDSASSYIYRTDSGACIKGAGGLHILVRVAKASEIPALGEAINARLWLAGFGYIGKSDDGKRLVRSLIDTSVWQPERLSFESGAVCGAGLEQRRPPIQHIAGGVLSLADVDLRGDDWTRYRDLVDAAKGVTPRAAVSKDKSRGRNPAAVREERAARPAVPLAPVKPLSPAQSARIMGALLHVPPACDYQTWISIGMALKTSCGDAGFALWDNWSKVAASYPGTTALRAKWATFDHGHVTIKTLYYHAKQYGWAAKTHKKLDEIAPLPVVSLPEDQHEPLATTHDVAVASAAIRSRLFEDVALSDEKGRVSAAQITTGVGKTSALRQMLADIELRGKNVTIVCKDKQQCGEYEAAGAFWRHGREFTPEGFQNPWHCPKAAADGPVPRLGEKEHRLQVMCKSGHCEHGNVMMLNRAEAKGVEPSSAVIQFFKDRPDLKYAPPCGWFDHNDEGKSRAVRVVTAAGLNASDLMTADHKEIDHLIIDESVQWAHSQFLGLDDVRAAIESLNKVIDQARACAPAPAFGAREEPEIAAALSGPLEAFKSLAEALGNHAAAAAAGAYTPVDFDLSSVIAGLGDGTDENGAAFWEKPEWKHWTELISVPLRALAAIKDGVKAGSLSMVDGTLHVTYLHPALTEAKAKGINITILDATLDQTAKGFVGGENVTTIAAHPNLTWKIDPRWFKSAKNKEQDLNKEAALLLDTRKKMEKETGRPSYILCRKDLALTTLAMDAKMLKKDVLAMSRDALWAISVDRCIGWWGWHDVAHDEWGGLNALLWGQIPIPAAVRLQEYADHRACLMMLGKVQRGDLPLPDNCWTSDQMVNTGQHMQKSLARLPDQPEVRAWLLQTVTNKKIQGAGRSRSARQEDQIAVWQIGGYPSVGLAEHGIRPEYARLIDGLSGSEVAALNAARRMELMTDAAALVVARGGKITRETVRESVRTLCKSLIDNNSSGKKSVRDRYIYIYQGRTENEALDSNKNNELQQPFAENDGVWDQEYALWRDLAPQHIKARFAYRANDEAQAQNLEIGEKDTQEIVTDMKIEEIKPRADKENDENTLKTWLSNNTPVLACTDGLVAAAQDAIDNYGREVMEEAAAMIAALNRATSGDLDTLETIAGDTLDYAAATPAELTAARLILAAIDAAIDAVPWGGDPVRAAAA